MSELNRTTKGLRWFVRRVCVWGLLLYVGAFVMAGCFADRMIFVPQPSSYSDGGGIIKVPVEDGQSISAVYLPNPDARFTILYSHGNAEDIGQNDFAFRRFRDHGYAVFAYDYRGYGTSDGEATVANAYKDADAAWGSLTGELGVEPGRVIVYGRSVGSGLATYLAEKYDVGGLVIQSGFVSAYRVVTKIPLLPFDKFNNLKRIKNVDCPVLITHGMDDQIVSFWHGEKLYEAANEPKFKLWVPHTGHNEDLVQIAGEAFWEKLGELEIAILKSQKMHYRAEPAK